MDDTTAMSIPNIPEELSALIEEMLDKNEEKRPSTAECLERAIAFHEKNSLTHPAQEERSLEEQFKDHRNWTNEVR